MGSRDIVVSEPDVQAALAHLCSMPHRDNLPVPWERQFVLDLLREAMPDRAKVDDCFAFAPGLFGVVKPFGTDLQDRDPAESRLQVWIAVRAVGTAPDDVTILRRS